jgi:hypothetical protein
LPEIARAMLISETKARDFETFQLLEETTDQETMNAFWSRKFRYQRDTVSMFVVSYLPLTSSC